MFPVGRSLLRSCCCAMETLHSGKRTSGDQCQGEKNYQAESKAPVGSRQCHIGIVGLLGSHHEKVRQSVWANIVSRRGAPDPPESTGPT